MVVLFLIVGGGLWYVGSQVSQAISGLIEEYTDKEPRTLPTVEISDEEVSSVRERFDRFREALQGGTAAPPLELSATDLNALVLFHPEFEKLKNYVFFDIADDLLKGEISLPLDILGLPFGKGLYLNGSAVFDLALDGQGLVAKISELEINGKSLPEQIMKEIKGENVLKDANFEGETKELLRKIKSLQIVDDKIVLELKEGEAPADAGSEASPDSATGSEEPVAEVADPAGFPE